MKCLPKKYKVLNHELVQKPLKFEQENLIIQSSATVSIHNALSLMHCYMLQSCSNTWYHDWNECVHNWLWRKQRSKSNTNCNTGQFISICNKRTSNSNMKQIMTGITLLDKCLFAAIQNMHVSPKGLTNIKVLILSALYSTGEIRSLNIHCKCLQTKLEDNSRAKRQ